MGIVDVYFGIQKQFQEKYGENTVVIFQKGTFYEIYSYEPDQAQQGTIAGNVEGSLAVELFIRDSDSTKPKPIQIAPIHPNAFKEPIGKAREISLILGLRLTSPDKKKPHAWDNPFMAGFPQISYENNRDMLLLYGYTIVRVDEVMELEGGKMREITQIISPATEPNKNITLQPTQTNTLVSIYIEYQRVRSSASNSPNNRQCLDTLTMVCGLSSIDVSTGINSISEVYSRTTDELYAIQEIYRFLNTFQPVEILLNCNKIPEEQVEPVTAFLKKELELDKYCSVIIRMNKIDSQFLKPDYQENILRKAFPPGSAALTPSPLAHSENLTSGSSSNTVPTIDLSGSSSGYQLQPSTSGTVSIIDSLNLEFYTYGRISYTCLLQHCYEHKESLISKLQKPKTNWTDQKSHLILAHNAIDQLDILPKPIHGIGQLLAKKSTSFDSLISVLDATNTKMGSRYLRERLLNPITNPVELNNFYSMTEEVLSIPGRLESLESQLRAIPDIEKFQRKVQLTDIRPNELSQLFSSYSKILEIYTAIYNICLTNPESTLKLLLLPEKSIADFNECLTYVWSMIDLDKLENVRYLTKAGGRQVTLMTEESFIKTGQDKTIDTISEELNQYRNYLMSVCQHLNNQLPGKRMKKIELKTDRKAKTKAKVTAKSRKPDQSVFEEDEETDGNLSVYLSASDAAVGVLKKCSPAVLGQIGPLEFDKFKASSYIIHSGSIDLCSNKIAELQNVLETLLLRQYQKIIFNIAERIYFSDLNSFIHRLDFICSNARTAIKYKYSRPILDMSPGRSYIDIQELRHPLIERIIRNEYITNDISLGINQTGILLFGINSSGKSSLTKSIGLAVIMAQAGMFVAGRMKYRPFQRIITRLSGHDDILRAQSSFVVEMMELKTILKNADANTLVFGDELAKTTEHSSAEGLTAATIEELSKRSSCFIFATHIHNLVNLEAVQTLVNQKKLRIFHLQTSFDSELGKLVYQRKLSDGPGSSLYGFDVCRNIGLPGDFIDRAQQIYRTIRQVPEKIVPTKKSKYNRKVYVDKCMFCGTSENLNTHHIKEQATADERGFIAHFHKNSGFNLMVLCKECHQKLHTESIILKQVQTLNGTYLKPTNSN